MNLSCNLVRDLLPLYAEDMCSEETRAALDEHFRECSACREMSERMRSPAAPPEPLKVDVPIAGYAKRVRRHRLRVGVSVLLVCVLGVCLLSLLGLTLQDMHREANLSIPEIEPGTHNLMAGPLESPSEEIGQYTLYTNYEQIKVTITSPEPLHGSVMLWDARNSDSFIRIFPVEGSSADCVFQGLTSANRYRITCEDLPGATLTVTAGHTVSFLSSLKNVLREIFL